MAKRSLKVGAHFQGYRITKALPDEGPIQVFSALRSSELRLDAVRSLYCMPAGSGDAAPAEIAEFTKGVERLKALKLPELPDVEEGGFSEGLFWVAVEQIRSEPLKSRLVQMGPEDSFPVGTCLRFLAHIARVLQTAAEQDIVHLGLSPYRVYCTENLELRKIAGLGILQLFKQQAPRIDEGAKLPYLAPEQLLTGRPVDTKTDVYALGMLFYELCTLELPFSDAEGRMLSPDVLVKLVLAARPESLRSKLGTPDFIDSFLWRLIVKMPEKRLRWEAVIKEANAAAALYDEVSGRASGTAGIERTSVTESAFVSDRDERHAGDESVSGKAIGGADDAAGAPAPPETVGGSHSAVARERIGEAAPGGSTAPPVSTSPTVEPSRPVPFADTPRGLRRWKAAAALLAAMVVGLLLGQWVVRRPDDPARAAPMLGAIRPSPPPAPAPPRPAPSVAPFPGVPPPEAPVLKPNKMPRQAAAEERPCSPSFYRCSSLRKNAGTGRP